MSGFKMPVLVKTRTNGDKEFVGLTGGEWIISILVIIGLYILMAGYFIALLTIAQTIRSNGDSVSLYPTSYFLLAYLPYSYLFSFPN